MCTDDASVCPSWLRLKTRTSTSPSYLVVPRSLSRCCLNSCLRQSLRRGWIFWEPSMAISLSSARASNNNNRRLSQACPFRWTSAGSPSQELPSGESSGDCARGGDTSRSRSLRPGHVYAPQRTAPEDGPGRERRPEQYCEQAASNEEVPRRTGDHSPSRVHRGRKTVSGSGR